MNTAISAICVFFLVLAAGGLGVQSSRQPPVIQAYAETDALPCGSGDIADDSVIYVNPANPLKSSIIADSKDNTCGGMAVFNRNGRLIQYMQGGKIGNVDLRQGFTLGGKSVTLVGANDRSNDTLRFYTVSPDTGKLTDVSGTTRTRTLAANYGFTLYQSPRSGNVYAFVSSTSGKIQQFLLGDGGSTVTATLVRTLDNKSITEGMVADDRLGHLYANRETVGTYKYDAEPTASGSSTKVISITSGHVFADLEGIDIVQGATPGKGYVIVSSQSRSEFAVYDLSPDNKYLQTFKVDGVTHTDGLSLTTQPFPGAPEGLLVVHDDSNSKTSNLKLVRLNEVVNLSAIR